MAGASLYSKWKEEKGGIIMDKVLLTAIKDERSGNLVPKWVDGSGVSEKPFVIKIWFHAEDVEEYRVDKTSKEIYDAYIKDPCNIYFDLRVFDKRYVFSGIRGYVTNIIGEEHLILSGSFCETSVAYDQTEPYGMRITEVVSIRFKINTTTPSTLGTEPEYTYIKLSSKPSTGETTMTSYYHMPT